jgi:hypothetical protein
MHPNSEVYKAQLIGLPTNKVGQGLFTVQALLIHPTTGELL